MPDILRIVTLSGGGRPVAVLDVEQTDVYEQIRSSFKFTPGPARQQTSQGSRRYAGSVVVGETHDAGQVEWAAFVQGTSADQVATRCEQLLSDIASAARGRLLEFRPDGMSAARSSFFAIVGPGQWTPSYEWAEFHGASCMRVEIRLPTEPLARWAPMTIRDDFAVDSIADYTFDTGAGTLSVSGGQMVPSSVARKRLYHSARGYEYADFQATIKVRTGATSSPADIRIGKRVSATTILSAKVWLGGGGAGNLEVQHYNCSSDTPLSSSVGIGTPVATTDYWLRFRLEGIVAQAEWWTTPPTPAGSPAFATEYLLSSSELIRPQYDGLLGQPSIDLTGSTNERYDNFTVEPYTRRNLPLPDTLRLSAVPGTAPAKAELVITPSGGAAPPVFCLAGWATRAEPWTMVWNGDFEETGTDGWSVAGESNMTNPATSITRVVTDKKFGVASAQVVGDGLEAFQGPHFRVYRRFTKGVTYTVKAWAQHVSGTPASLALRLGHGPSSDRAIGSRTTLTTAFQELTVTWTPTADRDYAAVAGENSNASASTWRIDGGTEYEGTTAPTRVTQTEGRGAAPPFGIIEAEACDTGDLVGWVITADASSRGGFKLHDAAVSGAESYLATWQVDPSLLPADDYTDGEIAVELWAVVVMTGALVTPKLTLSLRPVDGTAFGAERFTAEWGSAGKLLVKPSDNNIRRRFVRLGVLQIPFDKTSPRAVKLTVAGATSAGSSGTFGLDYLIVVPVRGRAAGPTGKPNDTYYPAFVASTAETTKTIRTDLSGLVAKPPAAPVGDHGLCGEPIELPPGDVDLLVKLSSLAPDDPTLDATDEQLAHTATVSVNVTPRSRMLRSA